MVLRFAYVGAALVSTVWLVLWQTRVVYAARAKANVKYPQSKSNILTSVIWVIWLWHRNWPTSKSIRRTGRSRKIFWQASFQLCSTSSPKHARKSSTGLRRDSDCWTSISSCRGFCVCILGVCEGSVHEGLCYGKSSRGALVSTHLNLMLTFSSQFITFWCSVLWELY
jgi:hypothetical protein